MTKLEKAQAARSAANEIAIELAIEGSEDQAHLFREMAKCSVDGLAALYDAIQARSRR